MLKGKTVVLGVSSSIAAYKIANLASMLVKQHANVRVIMTQNATNFITQRPLKPLPDRSAWLTPLTGTLSFRWSMCLWPSRLIFS